MTAVTDGCHQITARAVDDGGAFATDTVDLTVGTGCGQAPFLGAPVLLPARIEAENFDLGGQGVAYHDSNPGNEGGQYRLADGVDIQFCADTGGGYNTGWTEAGEWLKYTVQVPSAGGYTLAARVASSATGGTFHVEFGGVDLTGPITVPVTGGWQNWTTVTAMVDLPAGAQVMKFVADTADFNLNYFDITAAVSAVLPEVPTAGYALYPAYPNPFNPTTTLSFELPAPTTVRLTIHDVAGRLVRSLIAGATVGSGRHETVWNGRDDSGRTVAAGVYYYRLVAGGFTDTQRMALVK
jgi:hypothetical protein